MAEAPVQDALDAPLVCALLLCVIAFLCIRLKPPPNPHVNHGRPHDHTNSGVQCVNAQPSLAPRPIPQPLQVAEAIALPQPLLGELEALFNRMEEYRSVCDPCARYEKSLARLRARITDALAENALFCLDVQRHDAHAEHAETFATGLPSGTANNVTGSVVVPVRLPWRSGAGNAIRTASGQSGLSCEPANETMGVRRVLAVGIELRASDRSVLASIDVLATALQRVVSILCSSTGWTAFPSAIADPPQLPAKHASADSEAHDDDGADNRAAPVSDVAARTSVVACCLRALELERARLEELLDLVASHTASTGQRRSFVLSSHGSRSIRTVLALVCELLTTRERLPERLRPPKLHGFVLSLRACLENKGTEQVISLCSQFVNSKAIQGLCDSLSTES